MAIKKGFTPKGKGNGSPARNVLSDGAPGSFIKKGFSPARSKQKVNAKIGKMASAGK